MEATKRHAASAATPGRPPRDRALLRRRARGLPGLTPLVHPHLVGGLGFALVVIVALASPSARALDGLTGVTDAAGRYPAAVRFVARGAGQVVLLDARGLTYVPRAQAQPTVRLAFLGANPDPDLAPAGPLPGHINVLRGADPDGWRRGLTRYGELRYVELFPGIDMVVHATGGALKRDLVVAPHASPHAIGFRYEGARSVDVSPDGALLIDTGRGLMTEGAPVAWQERAGVREAVLVEWRVGLDGRVGYAVGDYDPALPLVIDPGLDFAAYVGGDGYDEVNAVTTDAQGNVYLAGSTTSVDLPMGGGGALQTLHTNSLSGKVYRSKDAFVMKLSPAGALVWATFWGGKSDKFPTSLCLDDPPTDETCNNAVASPWGLGGIDVAYGLAVDTDGTVAVVGETNAMDFPAFPPATAIQKQLSGQAFDSSHPDDHYASDAFFVTFDATGDSGWSTYLGGTRYDVARGVVFDSQGDAWVVGQTGSSNFPTTADKLQPYIGGPHAGLTDYDYDAFVMRIRAKGIFVNHRLAFSTTLGGADYDEANAVAVTTAGQVVIAGTTGGGALETPGGVQPNYAGGVEDGYVAILQCDGDKTPTLIYETYVGGSHADDLNDVAVLERPDGTLHRVLVVGTTDSPDLWTTACGAHALGTCGSDGTCDEDPFTRHNDAFLAAFDPNGSSSCVFRRYLGGASDDQANALDVDPVTGESFLTGTTWSADFPVIAAAQRTKADGHSAGCQAMPPFDCFDNSDAFFSRVSADGKDLLISTFLGGKGEGYDTDDAGRDIALGTAAGPRHVFVGGQTYAGDFPTFSPTLAQPSDVKNVANGFLVRAPIDIADLRIVDATLTPGAAKRGEIVVLGVTSKNDGPESTGDVKLIGKLSAPVTWVQLAPGCTAVPGGFRCLKPPKLSRGQATPIYALTFEAPSTRQILTIDLTATGSRRDPDDANNKRRLTLPVGGYDMGVTAAATPDPVGFGKLVTYTLAALNSGPEAAENVALTLHFDAKATFVAEQTDPTCVVDATSHVVTCSPLDTTVPPGQSVGPFKVALRAPETKTDLRATASFTATGFPADDQNHGNDSVALVTKVRPPDVQLVAATGTPEPVATDATLTLVATMKNAGPGDAKGPVLNIFGPLYGALPFEPQGSDVRCGQAVSAPPVDMIQCELAPDPIDGGPGVLHEGDSETFTVHVHTPSTPGPIAPEVTVVFTGDSDPSNNTKDVLSHVGYADVVADTITVSSPAQPPYGVGEPLTVFGTLTDVTADVDAKDVVVEYRATTNAAGATAPPFTGVTVSGAAAGGAPATCTAGPPVRCTFATIPGGGFATMTVTTSPTRRGVQAHTFAVISASTSDPVGGNNAKSLATPIDGYDLAFSNRTDATRPLRRGQPATWGQTITNLGPGRAKGAELEIAFNYGTAYYSWTGTATNSSGNACTQTAPESATCALGDLEAGASVDVTWQLTPLKGYKKHTLGDQETDIDLTLSAASGDDDHAANNADTITGGIAGADLALTATGPTSPVSVGDDVVLHAVIVNQSPIAAKSARLHVTYDTTRLSFTSSSDPARSCTEITSGTLRCELDPLAANFTLADMAVTFVAVAPGKAKTTLTVTDGPDEKEDVAPGDNSAEVTTTVLGPDIQVANAAQDVSNPVSVTGAVRYTFDVLNPSTTAATGAFKAVFTLDAAAAGKARIVNTSAGGSATCAVAQNERSVACTWPGGLPKAASAASASKVTVAADTLGLDRGSYGAGAAVQLLKDADSDPNPANNTFAPGTFSTTRQGHDLSVTATYDGQPAQKKRGEQLTYTITVKNSHKTTAKDVGLSFYWTGGLLSRDTTVQPPAGCLIYDSPGGAECDLGDLAYGETRTRTFTVNAIKAGDTRPVFAVAANGNPEYTDEPTSDDEITPLVHLVGADLAITNVTWPTGPITSGADVTLAVTVKNVTTGQHSPAVSKAVTLTHGGWGGAAGQSPNLTYTGSSIGQPTGGPSCVDHGGTLKCQLGSFLTDAEDKVYLHFKAGAPGTFTQTLTAAEPPGTADEDPSNNTVSHVTQVKGPDLVVTEVSADTPVGVGEPAVGIAYKVTNLSPDVKATGVKLTYTLSQQSTGPAGGFVPTVGHSSGCVTKSPDVVECTLPDLAPGASTSALSSVWDAKEIGDYRLVVRASSDAQDATAGDNVVIKTMEVKGPDIAVTGVPYTGPTARGTPFTINAKIDNLGLGVSEKTKVLLPLAPSINVESGEVFPTGSGTCAAGVLPDGQQGVLCDLGRVAKGDPQREIAMTLTATRKGTYIFKFTGVTQPHADSNAANDSAELVLDFPGADLRVDSITQTNPLGSPTLTHGDEVTYDVVIANAGPADALHPLLGHVYDPKHLAFVSASGDGTCANDPVGSTTCQLTGVTASNGAGVTLVYKALEPGTVTSSFEVDEPGQSDENPLDNAASKTTTIRGADVGVTLVDAPDPVPVGQAVTYTSTVKNWGPGKADNVVASLRLPPEVKFVSASPGCTAGLRTVECAPYDLPSGDSRVWTVTATAMKTTPAARACSSAAAVGSEEAGPKPDEAWVSTTITDGDADEDGVSGQTEDGAPNHGDGNGDGTPDSQQPGVTSVPSSRGDYVTLETSAGALKNVAFQTPPAPTPAGVAFPVGAFHYEVTGLSSGAATTVTVTMPTGVPAWAFWKFGPEPGNTTPHWYDFSYDGTTGAQKIGANKLEIALVDGGRGDDDLAANGTIIDPGAPALRLLVVDSAGDGPDASPGDGVCDVGDGGCTLRAAIEESNAHAAAHLIGFSVAAATLPVQIDALGGLPPITAPAVIDGATQPGWVDGPVVTPVVTIGAPSWSVVAGDSALRSLDLPGGVAVSGAGRVLVTDGSTGVDLTGVDGCLIRRSRLDGVSITGPAAGNRIEGNDIGGMVTLSDASDTTVRGNAIHDALTGDAVTISGGGAMGNRVVDNIIGLDADGACTHYVSDPNTNTPGAGPCEGGASGWGVHLTGGASGNTVGGAGFREGNLISANALGGVLVDGGAHDNTVAGNLFGTDLDGVAERHPVSHTYQLENRGPCVQLQGAADNLVGGSTEGARNLCAGRGMKVMAGAERSELRGNWIMLDARGDVPWVRLSLDDVLLVQDATDTVIAGNVVPTVEVKGTASGTTIEDNLIGTDPSGTEAFYADRSIPGTTRVWSRGVLIHGSATSTTVRGNQVSGSYLHGVDIWENASFVTLQNNRVGVDASGQAALPNLKSGIHVDARYGGTVSDVLIDGNVVAGNGTADDWVSDPDWPFPGIWIREGAARVTVRDNTVGLGTDGTTPLGHRNHGIWANGAPSVAITGNRVGANAGDGILVDDGPLYPYPSTGVVLRGNVVGTDALGLLDLGNTGHGIHVHETGGAQIGGSTAGEGNTVAHNGGAGIWVEAGGVGAMVRGNSLFANGWLGFDLNSLGVDDNGVYDGATNGDPEQPVLTAASESGGTITVSGTHDSAVSGTYVLDFYLDQTPDPSGHGEGRTWLGSSTLSGTGTFSVDLPRSGAVGTFVSATATDAAGNTSELSHDVPIASGPGWADVGVALADSPDPTCVGCLVTWTATVSVLGPSDASNVSLVFDYPSGVTVFGESAASFTCLSNPPTTTCNAASLSAGTYQIYFDGVTTAPGQLTATAQVSTDTTDPAPSNDSDTATTTVGPADLQIAVADPGVAAVGAPMELVATVSNPISTGGSLATPTVTLALPAGVTLDTASADAGTCTDSGGVVTCALSALDGDLTTQVHVTVTPQQVGDVSFPFGVTAANPDGDLSNNTATATVDVRDSAYDLTVAQLVTTAAPAPDAPFTYLITVTNEGPSPAVEVELLDTLQMQAYPVQAVPSQGECYREEDGEGTYLGRVRCYLGSLASGASATVSIDALTAQSVSIQNETCVEAVGEDLDPTSDCRTTLTPVGAVDLLPALSAAPNPGTAGQPLTVTATVHNAGPGVARAATVAVGMPNQVTFASADAPCTVAFDAQTGRDIATCTLGEIAANADASVAIALDVSVGGTGLPFTAKTASDSLDTQTYNDEATFYLNIDEAPPGPCPPERQVVLFSDTDEGGGGGWMTTVGDYCNLADCSPAVWSLVSDVAQSGTHSWHVPGFDGQARVTHRMTDPVSLVGVTEPEAVFWHRWDFQAGVDGGQVYVSPGSTFGTATPTYTLNPPATPTAAFSNEAAYSGQNAAWPAFEESRIDLASFIGQDVHLMFTAETDTATGGPGWWVDGVEIHACQDAGAEPLSCPEGYELTELLADATESGGGGWAVDTDDTCSASDCSQAHWQLATDAAHSGATSWFVPDLDGPSVLSLVQTQDIDLIGDIKTPEVQLFHRHALEMNYDGGKIAVSTDGGQTWADASYAVGGPTAGINVLGGGLGFTGQNTAWPGFDEVRVDLSAYVGQHVRLRFRVGTDGSTGAQGWWVDDVVVHACTKVPTPTETDLAVSLTGPTAAQADVEPLTYQLSVDNAGPLDATGVVVNVAFPQGLTLSSTGCEAATGGLTCAVGPLAVGGTAQLTLSGYGSSGGDLAVVATVSGDQPDPVGTNDTAAVTTSVHADTLFGAHLELVSAPDTLVVGASGVLTWALSNLGPNDAALTFSVAVPAGLTATTPPTCTRNGAQILCDRGTVLAGAGAAEVSLNVTATTLGTATFVAALSPTEGVDPDALDPDPTDDAVVHAIAVVPPAAAADLGVAVTASAPTLLVGEDASFTVTVSNGGPELASNVQVTLTTSGATFAAMSTGGTTSGAACDQGTCTLPALPAGEVWELVVSGTAEVAGTLTVGAGVQSDTVDAVPTNNTGESSADALALAANLSVTWSDPPVSARAGEPFTLTAAVDNGGPLLAEASGLVLEVTGSGRLTAVPQGCVRAASGAGAWCDLGDVTGGGHIDLGFQAVSEVPETSLTVTATVSTTTVDAAAVDDVAVADVGVFEASADLALAATVETAATVTIGDSVSVRFDVSNAAGDPVVGTRLAITLPSAAADATATSDRGACVAGSEAVFCDIGSLAPTESAQIGVDLRVTEPGAHEVLATLAAEAADPAPGNNTAQVGFTALYDCAGACDDGDPCTTDGCESLTGCVYAPAADGTACDDGQACTSEDACFGGVCLGGGPAACDDDNPCTLDACVAGSGCVNTPATLLCDDGDVCTTSDLCVDGACVPGEALDCDDGDPCTNDSCDPIAGCVHDGTGVCCTTDADCSAGVSECQVASCDTGTGLCVFVPVEDGSVCDADSSVCTDGDGCVAGVCVPGDALDCDDGDVCTTDACDPSAGCTHAAIEGCCATDADCPASASECQVPSCDATTGVCAFVAVEDGTACDADASVCTDADACVAGSCVPGDALDCDDGDVCTVDACDPTVGCQHTPSADETCGCTPAAYTTSCLEGDVVWSDGCGAPGATAVACDDADVETDDRCDAGAAVCLHVPQGSEGCDVSCAGEWTRECLGGHVMWRDPCGDLAGVAAACSSSDPCRLASCDEAAAACVFSPSGEDACGADGGCDATRELACEGGDLVWRDGCGGTVGIAMDCDDGDVGTDDACDPEALRCVSVPSGAALPSRLCETVGGDGEGAVEADGDVLVADGDVLGAETNVIGDTSASDLAELDGSDGGLGERDDARHDRRHGGGCGECSGGSGGAGGGGLVGVGVALWLLLRRRRREAGAPAAGPQAG